MLVFFLKYFCNVGGGVSKGYFFTARSNFEMWTWFKISAVFLDLIKERSYTSWK